VGYSEGAWVVDLFLKGLSNQPALAGRIAGVILFGDPEFDSKVSPATFLATGPAFWTDGSGVARILNVLPVSPYLPQVLASPLRARSYCLAHDIICHSSSVTSPDAIDCAARVSGLPKPCAHLEYVDSRITATGAAFLASTLW
jgi:hypothetical protein